MKLNHLKLLAFLILAYIAKPGVADMCYHSDYYSKDYKNIHPWSLGYPSYCHDWKAIPHIGPYEHSFEYHRNDSFDLDFDCHAGPKKPCGLGYIEQIDKLKTVIEKLKSKISKLEAKEGYFESKLHEEKTKHKFSLS